MLDDLPWGETSLVRVGSGQVEVELIERRLGQEVGAILESFQVEELVFDEAVDGFDVALVGGSGGLALPPASPPALSTASHSHTSTSQGGYDVPFQFQG